MKIHIHMQKGTNPRWKYRFEYIGQRVILSRYQNNNCT